MVLPVGALAIGGGLGGIWSFLRMGQAQRAREAEQQRYGGAIEALIRGEDALVEGPPRPNPYLTDAEIEAARSLGGAEGFDLISKAYLPRVAQARALARQQELLRPENRALANTAALAADEDFFETYDEVTGSTVAVPTSRNDTFLENAAQLRTEAQSIEGVTRLMDLTNELRAEGIGSLAQINPGDERVGEMRNIETQLLLQLRNTIAGGLGAWDRGTQELFQGFGLGGQQGLVETIFASPDTKLTQLATLGQALADNYAGLRAETRLYQGLDPGVLERGDAALQGFTERYDVFQQGLGQPGRQAMRSFGEQALQELGIENLDDVPAMMNQLRSLIGQGQNQVSASTAIPAETAAVTGGLAGLVARPMMDVLGGTEALQNAVEDSELLRLLRMLQPSPEREANRVIPRSPFGG